MSLEEKVNFIIIPIIQIDNNNLIYVPRLLTTNQKYWMTKLAFINKVCKDKIFEINFYEGSKFELSKEKNVSIIPANTPEPIQCYLLRAIIDYIQISRNNLPLHAAAIAINDFQLLIFANSGNGKSYISKLLTQEFPNSFVIGDDHIVLCDSYVQGNTYMRSRIPNSNNSNFIKNHNIDSKKPLLLVCYENDNNSQVCQNLLTLNELLIKIDNLTAFKYLSSNIILNKIDYSITDIFDTNIMEKYHSLSKNFLSSAKAISIIGNYDYAVDQIKKFIIYN